MKKLFRKIHRWLGLLMAFQILAWMVSGFYFALFPIENIRGEHLAAPAGTFETKQFAGSISPDDAWQTLSVELGGDASLQSVGISMVDGEAAYLFSGTRGQESYVRRVHAIHGNVMPMLDEQTARRIAADATVIDEAVDSIEFVTAEQPGSEYRGRRLPLWRVVYSGPESLNVYVDAWSGEVVARRTQGWRIFDFLWMLHIMDFSERDDFNTPLLQISALLGLVLALSGLVYWGMTTRVFRRRPEN